MNEDDIRALVEDNWKYRTWKAQIIESGCEILDEKIRCVAQRDAQSFYSAMIDFTLMTPEKNTLSRCLVLRGPSVVIIPILVCDSVIKTVMVRQRRIVNGNFSLEFPSGGIGSDGNPKLAAINESWEELGIKLSIRELVQLTDRPLVVCDSIMDEVVHWFYFKREVSKKFLSNLNCAKTGQVENQEYISLEVMSFSEIIKANNFQTLVGLQLLQLNGVQI